MVAEHDGELTCLSRNAIDSSVKMNKCNKTGNVSVYIVDENAVVEEMNKGKSCSSHDFIQNVPFSLQKRLPYRFQLHRLKSYFAMSTWAEFTTVYNGLMATRRASHN